jgi:hypothetical protein
MLVVKTLNVITCPGFCSSDSYTSLPLRDADSEHLILTTSPSDLFGTNSLVDLPCRAADERLIDLNLTRDLREGSGLHRQPNPLQHKPRRLLCHTKATMKFP